MIKGIDLQVAVQRVTDHAKDVAGQMRRYDAAQQFTNQVKNAQDERARSAVAKKDDTAQVGIHKDKDGGQGGGTSSGEQKKQPPAHSPLHDLDVGPVTPRLLDIDL